MVATDPHETRRVVFLVFPRVMLLDLTGPWEVLELASRLAGEGSPAYKLELVSGANHDTVPSGAGISMQSHQTAANCRGDIDTLIVPATDDIWSAEPAESHINIIRRLAARSRRVVSICGGAFFLAKAGLLDGRRATTHWSGTEDLAARFPLIDVSPDSIFVKDGNTYTSAGVTAGVDLALSLVEEDLGHDIALEAARYLVVFMRRPGGQSQFSSTLEAQHSERNTINELIAWAIDNLSANLSVQAMAERARMSPRNFSRVFSREVGKTPAAFVEQLRVDAARRFLEAGEGSLKVISRKCGFNSTDSMRRSFRKLVRVAPNDYRDRFRHY